MKIEIVTIYETTNKTIIKHYLQIVQYSHKYLKIYLLQSIYHTVTYVLITVNVKQQCAFYLNFKVFPA